MRWSQTANYGLLPNPRMPNSFVAQVYDLGDPWAAKEKGWTGGEATYSKLRVTFTSGPNHRHTDSICCHAGDPENCSLPDPTTGRYGPNCTAWDKSKWSPGMQAYAPLIRQNAPSGGSSVEVACSFIERLNLALQLPTAKIYTNGLLDPQYS